MDVAAVAVVELDVDEVRVQLRVDGHRVRHRARVEVVVLLAPVGADPSSGDKSFSRWDSDLKDLKENGLCSSLF